MLWYTLRSQTFDSFVRAVTFSNCEEIEGVLPVSFGLCSPVHLRTSCQGELYGEVDRGCIVQA